MSADNYRMMIALKSVDYDKEMMKTKLRNPGSKPGFLICSKINKARFLVTTLIMCNCINFANEVISVLVIISRGK